MIDYESYYRNVLELNDEERQRQEALVPQLPERIIDVHVHMADASSVQLESVPPHVYGHMMSTFPVNTMERSAAIDDLLLPGIDVRKLRFAHAFKGILHRHVNEYLVEHNREQDRTAVFGVSEYADDIDYTIDELGSGRYVALKMYYMATNPPKKDLYSYFPPKILSVAEKYDTPIILHLPKTLYGSMDELRELTHDFPRLNVMLAHVGVVHTVLPGLEDILAEVATMQNVHVDTSGVHDPQVISRAVHHLGYERVLYGSDEPLNLIRAMVYMHPTLGPRLLTDYSYHWANAGEQAANRHLGMGNFVHSQWQQLEAVLGGITMQAYGPAEQHEAIQAVFRKNAEELFGFEA